MMLPGFDGRTHNRWRGEVLPAPYRGRWNCRCGDSLKTLEPFTLEPLFLHGGYGEAVRMTVAVCPTCHRSQIVARESVRPLIPARLG